MSLNHQVSLSPCCPLQAKNYLSMFQEEPWMPVKQAPPVDIRTPRHWRTLTSPWVHLTQTPRWITASFVCNSFFERFGSGPVEKEIRTSHFCPWKLYYRVFRSVRTRVSLGHRHLHGPCFVFHESIPNFSDVEMGIEWIFSSNFFRRFLSPHLLGRLGALPSHRIFWQRKIGEKKNWSEFWTEG